jgi:ornithine decarboxylase
LIDSAKALNLDIAGTSFHVGSAGTDPNIFKDALEFATEVIQYARSVGYNNCNLLDIGGGFTKDNFVDATVVINTELTKIHNALDNINVIAEPGR